MTLSATIRWAYFFVSQPASQPENQAAKRTQQLPKQQRATQAKQQLPKKQRVKKQPDRFIFECAKALAVGFFICASCVGQAHATAVVNYGENLAPLVQKIAYGNLHILQIGDSHTAADYFTEQLRKQLQSKLGDGGIGFAPPMKVKGQRVARHGYSTYGWRLKNSKFHTANFPLGGYSAEAYGSDNALTLTSEYYHGEKMRANIMVKHHHGGVLSISDASGRKTFKVAAGDWQNITTTLRFPATLSASVGMHMGGVWLSHGSGGVVSSMGINGATQSYWSRWRQGSYAKLADDLQQSGADLVILAYGTNEAFANSVFDQEKHIRRAVASIREGLPRAAILIIGAPESLKSQAGSCGTRPAYLTKAQENIRAVAMQERTLYWSWQRAMGGQCSMKSWINQGLSTHDGVHFTRAGYELAAQHLFENLYPLINGKLFKTKPVGASQGAQSYHQKNTKTRVQIHNKHNSTHRNAPKAKGSGYMCFSGQCKHF